MTRYVALLRGVNVGGRRSVKMEVLREILEQAAATDVATYIQSGNVVFSHRSDAPSALESDLERRIEAATSLAVPVVVRSAAEWAELVDANPFPEADGTHLHVVVAKETIPVDALEALDLGRFTPEEVVAHGRELYLHLPEGMGRAKLPTEVERRGPAEARGTARNWRTVVRLRDMLGH